MNSELRFRQVLRLNALFSTACALLILAAPQQLGAIIGWQQPWFYRALALGLLVFALDLLHQSVQVEISSWRGYLASTADLLWVAATAVVLIGFGAQVTTSGWAALIGVAAVVLLCGLLQLYTLNRIASSDKLSEPV